MCERGEQEISYAMWGLVGHKTSLSFTVTTRQKSEYAEHRSILWIQFDKISVWKDHVASGEGEKNRETEKDIDVIILARYKISLDGSGVRECKVWYVNSADMVKLNFTDEPDGLGT